MTKQTEAFSKILLDKGVLTATNHYRISPKTKAQLPSFIQSLFPSDGLTTPLDHTYVEALIAELYGMLKLPKPVVQWLADPKGFASPTSKKSDKLNRLGRISNSVR
jgi:hypothetical protein